MKKLSLTIALAFIVLAFCSCGASGYEAPLATYFDAIEDENAGKYYNIFVDPYLEKYLYASQSETVKNEDDILNLMEKEVTEKNDGFKDRVGNNFNFKYEVTRVREFHSEDIGYFAKYLDKEYDYDSKAVENAVILFVDYRASGDKDTEKVLSEEFVMIQISGKWYMSYLIDTLDEVKDAIEETALG